MKNMIGTSSTSESIKRRQLNRKTKKICFVICIFIVVGFIFLIGNSDFEVNQAECQAGLKTCNL